LLDLIQDSNGKGNETDEKVTPSRALAEVGVQSQKKKHGENPIQRNMKQAERVDGVDEEDKGRTCPQINAEYIKSGDEKIIGIHYQPIPCPGRMMEPGRKLLHFPNMVFQECQIKNFSLHEILNQAKHFIPPLPVCFDLTDNL